MSDETTTTEFVGARHRVTPVGHLPMTISWLDGGPVELELPFYDNTNPPADENGQKRYIGGFRIELLSAESETTPGDKVMLDTGYGCGNLNFYLHRKGQSYVINTEPFIRFLIETMFGLEISDGS